MKNTMVEKKVRKIFELAMAIVLMAAFASCGNDASQEDSQIESSSLQEAEAVESAEEAQSQTDSEESAESETETEESEAEELVRGIDLSNAEVTEVLKVAISGNFSQSTSLENLYNVNVYHTDLLGRFGCPIEIHSDNFEEAVIVFEYNPDELYALPCENLIILHYDEENDHYDIVESKLNEEEHTIGAQITETGVYMLTNGYQWCSFWGLDVSQFTSPQTIYTDSDYRFEITIPQGIAITLVTDYLKAVQNLGRV